MENGTPGVSSDDAIVEIGLAVVQARRQGASERLAGLSVPGSGASEAEIQFEAVSVSR